MPSFSADNMFAVTIVARLHELNHAAVQATSCGSHHQSQGAGCLPLPFPVWTISRPRVCLLIVCRAAICISFLSARFPLGQKQIHRFPEITRLRISDFGMRISGFVAPPVLRYHLYLSSSTRTDKEPTITTRNPKSAFRNPKFLICVIGGPAYVCLKASSVISLEPLARFTASCKRPKMIVSASSQLPCKVQPAALRCPPPPNCLRDLRHVHVAFRSQTGAVNTGLTFLQHRDGLNFTDGQRIVHKSVGVFIRSLRLLLHFDRLPHDRPRVRFHRDAP